MDMALINKLVTDNLQFIILGMIVLLIIALIIFISVNVRLAKLNKRYRNMMKGMEGANLEKMMLAHINEVRLALDNVEKLSVKYKMMEDVVRLCVQRVGIVRFNAFEDTGSDLSFAIALLDSNNNGVVISSIFARNDSRTYAKPVVNGQSNYFLTTEEKEALSKAREKSLKLD